MTIFKVEKQNLGRTSTMNKIPHLNWAIYAHIHTHTHYILHYYIALLAAPFPERIEGRTFQRCSVLNYIPNVTSQVLIYFCEASVLITCELKHNQETTSLAALHY